MRVRQLKLDVVWIVLVPVIEPAVVHRVEGKIAVTAAAVRGRALAARAVDKMLLTRQRVQCICRQVSGVTDLL